MTPRLTDAIHLDTRYTAYKYCEVRQFDFEMGDDGEQRLVENEESRKAKGILEKIAQFFKGPPHLA